MALTPADIVALSRLLDEATELDAGGREQLLATLPPAQRHLGAPLREMLAQHDRDTAALATLPRLADEGAVAAAGERVGPYRLLDELGRGGMGSVWRAERADGRFERVVALKLPRLAWDAGLGERMAREVRIGARLEHPAIARLYDAGVDERGRPYIAMECIAGRPIDAWCREHALDTRARLALFVQVVQAVAHAHGRLVVHRDLKPANILVDDAGRAHLLDFGIAKLLAGDTSGPTLEQGRALTPSYASPEQIAGQPVGVATDIYSLGVVLFELLAGRLPYAPARPTLGAVEEAILAGDAPPASSAAADPAARKALRGEVDAILAKALRREPDERYASADAFADDIERQLAGETVRARPDSRWYRLRKLLARHRTAFAAGALVLAAIVAGGTATMVQARRAAREAERARQVTRFVAEMFRVNATAGAVDGPAPASAPGELLDRTARLIEGRFADQPELQAELYGTVGRIYVDIGAGRLAVQYATRQLEVLDRIAAPPERRANAHLLLGEADRDEGRLADAEANARTAVALLAAAGPALQEARLDLFAILVERGQMAEARRLLDSVASAAAPDTLPPRTTAKLLAARATLLNTDNHGDEAAVLIEQAIGRALAADGPQSPIAHRLRSRLAYLLVTTNRADQARPYIDADLTSLRSAGAVGQVQAAVSAADYASVLHMMGATDYGTARRTIEQARASLAPWRAALPARIPARIDFALAEVQMTWGDLAAAERLLAGATPVLEASTERLFDRWSLAASQAQLAMKAGRHRIADAAFRRRLSLRHEMGQGRSPFAAADWAYLAQNLMMAGDLDGAGRVLADAPDFAVARGDARAGDGYPRLVPNMRARLLHERGDPGAAWAALERQGGDDGDVDTNSSELDGVTLHGEVLCAAGRPHEGLRRLTKVLQMTSPLVSEREPGLARTRAIAGLCALATGERALARRLAAQARRAFTEQPAVSPWYKAPLAKLERALGTAPKSTSGKTARAACPPPESRTV